MEDFKILTMQDLSCVGQCSLTVALPILSHYGFETCVLPTAILSNHTMFSSWSYLDLTKEIENIFKEWEKNDLKFNAFLLGYLGKKDLIDIASACFEKFSCHDSQIIIDPVFADFGKIYPGFDMDYVMHLKGLLKYADVILPNVTEASFLTGIKYEEEHSDEWVKKIIFSLRKYTDAKIVITGVEKKNSIGEYILSGEDLIILEHEKLPLRRHGTGDIFSSVFTANYLLSKDVIRACDKAALFVRECLKITSDKHFYGVEFERILNDERK